MKIKLDENLGQQGAILLRDAGHEVATVLEQELCAADDHTLISICQQEQRCLVTLDLDYANPLLFKPDEYAGIVVLRLPPKATYADLLDAIHTLIKGLTKAKVNNKLWIIHKGRIREYQPESQTE